MNKRHCVLFLAATSLSLSGCSYMPSWAGGSTSEKPKLAGERHTALPIAAELQPDAALQKTPLDLPSANANSDWPEHSGSFKAARANLAFSGNFEIIDHASAGEGQSYEHPLVVSPVVGGGMVFAMDSGGHISAHDVGDINTRRWDSKGVAEEDDPDVLGGGLSFDDGKIYATSGYGKVAAFDAANGKELWNKNLRLPFRSAPKVAGGKLFAITIDNQTYALNAKNGDVLWTHRGIGETSGLMHSVSPTVDNDVVVIPYSSGEIYVLAIADGKELWSDTLGGNKRTQASALFAGIGGDPITDGGVVFAVSSGGSITVKSLAGGRPVWERPVGSVNTPWMVGDHLFVLSSDNTLVNFVKFNGHIRWSTKLASFEDEKEKRHPITWKGPVMAGGKLAIVGSNGQLLLVSPDDGKILETKSIPEDIYTAPIVAAGKMFLMGKDARLYSIK